MCHGSRAVSSLFLTVILRVATVEIHGCRASITSAPTLATLEQAAAEQLDARRNSEHAFVEALNRIARLDQALQ